MRQKIRANHKTLCKLANEKCTLFKNNNHTSSNTKTETIKTACNPIYRLYKKTYVLKNHMFWSFSYQGYTSSSVSYPLWSSKATIQRWKALESGRLSYRVNFGSLFRRKLHWIFWAWILGGMSNYTNLFIWKCLWNNFVCFIIQPLSYVTFMQL